MHTHTPAPSGLSAESSAVDAGPPRVLEAQQGSGGTFKDNHLRYETERVLNGILPVGNISLANVPDLRCGAAFIGNLTAECEADRMHGSGDVLFYSYMFKSHFKHTHNRIII